MSDLTHFYNITWQSGIWPPLGCWSFFQVGDWRMYPSLGSFFLPSLCTTCSCPCCCLSGMPFVISSALVLISSLLFVEMFFCWLYRTLTFNVHWRSLQLTRKPPSWQPQISTAKGSLPSQGRRRPPPSPESKSCSILSFDQEGEGWNVRLTDREVQQVQ